MFNRNRLLIGLVVLALAACLPWATAEEAKEPPKIDLTKGGLTIQSGYNSITFGVKLQFRWTLDNREQYDRDTAGIGDGEPDGAVSAFSIPRARLTLRGGAFKPWLKYEFEFEMAGTKGTDSNKIKDALILVDRYPLASLKFGQYKTPFSLQELMPDPRIHFVERSITNPMFAAGRDLGVMVYGLTKSKKFGYGAGVFNGGGESNPQDDRGYMAVGRAYYDPFGEFKLFESGNDASDKAVLHFGLGARAGEQPRGTNNAGVYEQPNDETAYNFEFAYRWSRLYATAEYFDMRDSRDNPPHDPPLPPVDSRGWHAQFGFMVLPTAFEIAGRYAQIDSDRDLCDDEVTEARLGVNWYIKSHNFKLQADFGYVEYGRAWDAGSTSALPSSLQWVAASRLGKPSDNRLVTGQDLMDKQVRVQLAFAAF